MEVQKAADYVREHPGCIQSNVIEHIMSGRSFGYARARVVSAIDAGLIVAHREGNRLHLYPPESRGGTVEP